MVSPSRINAGTLAETFTTTCWHQHQAVFISESSFNNCFLRASKCPIPKDIVEKVLSDQTLRLLLKKSGVKTTNYNTFLPFSENLRLMMAVILSTSHLSKHLNDLAISSKKKVFLTAVTTEAYDLLIVKECKNAFSAAKSQ